MTARLPSPSLKLPGPSRPHLSTRQPPSRRLPACPSSAIAARRPISDLHHTQTIPPAPSCPLMSSKLIAPLRLPRHAHSQPRSSEKVQPQKTSPFIFSTLRTLFNSQFRPSPFLCSRCALFAKNTRGWGAHSTSSQSFQDPPFRLTLVESNCFANLPRNSFRILFVQNQAYPTQMRTQNFPIRLGGASLMPAYAHGLWFTRCRITCELR
jgi:hypothetical protein